MGCRHENKIKKKEKRKKEINKERKRSRFFDRSGMERSTERRKMIRGVGERREMGSLGEIFGIQAHFFS